MNKGAPISANRSIGNSIVTIVVEIWDEKPIIRINQYLELLEKFGADLDDLCKETNVTGRGETATNPSSVEMRPR